MSIRCALFMVAVSLMVACAHQWVKDGASAHDLARDKFECHKEVTRMTGRNGTQSTTMWNRFMLECMEGKGWERE